MRPPYPSVNLPRVIINLRRFWSALSEEDKFKQFDLSQAVVSCGYNTYNGTARTFLDSAQQFGLIEYANYSHIFQFAEAAMNVLEVPNDLSAVKRAAFRPPIFHKIYQYFNEELFVSRLALLVFAKEFALTPHGQQGLVDSFFKTIEYVRELSPPELKRKIHLYNQDGLVSVHFPFNYKKSKIEQFFNECLEKIEEESCFS